jgi:hypothetical protein
VAELALAFDAVAISALEPKTFSLLLEKIDDQLSQLETHVSDSAGSLAAASPLPPPD